MSDSSLIVVCLFLPPMPHPFLLISEVSGMTWWLIGICMLVHVPPCPLRHPGSRWLRLSMCAHPLAGHLAELPLGTYQPNPACIGPNFLAGEKDKRMMGAVSRRTPEPLSHSQFLATHTGLPAHWVSPSLFPALPYPAIERRCWPQARHLVED